MTTKIFDENEYLEYLKTQNYELYEEYKDNTQDDGFQENYKEWRDGKITDKKEKELEEKRKKLPKELRDNMISPEVIEEMEKEIKKKTPTDAREKVLELLGMGQRNDATELIVTGILSTEHIYTTRDDLNAEMWIYMDGIYLPQARTYIKEWCSIMLGKAYTTHLCNQVIAKIEATSYIEQDEFFKEEDVNLIAVKNGVLNLKTRKLLPFNPKYRFFNKLPMPYNKNVKCIKIKKFLNDILKKDDVIVMEEVFGNLLYRDYKYRKSIMNLGVGSNGKSVLLDLMKRFLGVDNCVEIPLEDLENDSFAMGFLFKKLANLCDDLSKTALKNTGIFKKLTGKGLVSANRKFKSRVNFVNYAKMVFACNELPITYDKQLAFFDRWIIIDFVFTFLNKKEIDMLPKDERKNIKLRNTNIIDGLISETEMSGLLNIALDGLHRLFKNKEFSYSSSIEETKNKWLRKSSSINAFIMDKIIVDGVSEMRKETFRNNLSEYCRKYKLEHPTDKSIKHILNTQHGVSDKQQPKDDDGSRPMVWVGIRSKDDDD